MVIFPVPQPLFLLSFVLVFTYFLLAGGHTFERSPDDDLAGMVAQISFLGTGAVATWLLGFRRAIPLWNGIGSALLLLGALLLYEWARREIRERGFHIAGSSDVPEALCDEGPYAFIRHPVYVSYMLAFLAQLVALPGLGTGLIFLANMALFTLAAANDEKSLSRSALADVYARYKRRTGMFFPRLFRRTDIT